MRSSFLHAMFLEPEQPKEIAELREVLYALGPYHDDLGKEGRGQIVMSMIEFAKLLPGNVMLDIEKTKALPRAERWRGVAMLRENWRRDFEEQCNSLLGAESPVRVVIDPYCAKGQISFELLNQG